MIDIKKLQDSDVKRAVVYISNYINGTGETEQGHITSWNDKFIFVDYGNSCGRGIATEPDDLNFMTG